MRLALFLLPVLAAQAQLIPNGQAIPKGPNPPVVFMNGYQLDCGGSSFASTFGNADQVLQASQTVSLFFDNCTVPNKPSLEAVGAAFGQFLAGLKFTDGTAVPQVDVVAHSMGGLIVRSYLAGKQDISPAAFKPPVNPGIRKIVFLATPHFGTSVASRFGNDQQTAELAPGSQFLFDLNTWDNGTDDLRGIEALAVAGDGGTGTESSIPGFDDGVVTLTSASLGFVRAGRTRVVPVCHTSGSLISVFNLCQGTAVPIAAITDASNIVGQIVVSFLAGNGAWQSIGTAVESDPVGSTLAGINIQAEDLNGAIQAVSSASVQAATGKINLTVSPNGVAYSEGVTPKVSLPTQVQPTGGALVSTAVTLPAATVLPVIAKPGPVIARAFPSGSVPFPYDIAPGSLVSIYGSNLAATPVAAATQPLPLQLSDAQVLVNGTAAPLLYVSPTQINVLYPDVAPGVTQLTVSNGAGKHTVNIMVVAALPSVFSLDGSGSGPAIATNGITGQLLLPGVSLHAGDFATLYVTGLGHKTPLNGLSYAVIAPTVTIGGAACAVSFAGAAPGFAGLDQINCQVPAGITSVTPLPLVVTSNGVASNITTISIQ